MYSRDFPNSNNLNFKITSEVTNTYNCIAWAYGTNSNRMWPNLNNYYWPIGIPKAEHINSFIELFKSIGYDVCSNGSLENSFEKICIYEKDGLPSHAAKQLLGGIWTSKLGLMHDVDHQEHALDDGSYGNISTYMKRKIV